MMRHAALEHACQILRTSIEQEVTNQSFYLINSLWAGFLAVLLEQAVALGRVQVRGKDVCDLLV